MKCYYCGSELNEKATYCLNCGKKVGDTDNNFSKKGEYVGKGEPISKKNITSKKENYRYPFAWLGALPCYLSLYLPFAA